ncbi:C-type lectin domain family 4 member M-like [Misgurnus anguillicaudatus]|uniref:C-type lectin domain family 4 member M-like n=1 Tax=Misgurnus anguillicaudatus TaxID=75329 RepID=UPI003CCF6073
MSVKYRVKEQRRAERLNTRVLKSEIQGMPRKKMEMIYENVGDRTKTNINTNRQLPLQDGWTYYQSSFYFISTEKKSWTDSRRYCRERGADLIIINNKEEQGFIKQITCENQLWHWIGLTDIDVEGRWKWVDGSTLNTGFWRSREPNGGRDENCVETHSSGWNDFYCNKALKWSCEKKLF